MPHFIVLAITYIVGLLAFAVYQTLCGKQVVYYLSVFLFLLPCVGQWIITYQFIYNSFEYDVKTLDRAGIRAVRYEYGLCGLRRKEALTQIPQLQGFVRVVFVLNLSQSSFAEAVQIGFESFPSYQLELTAQFHGESIGICYVIQNGEVNNGLFIKVDLPFFIDWIQINGTALLHNGCLGGHRARPVYFVQTAMQVLDDKEEEALVFAVKPDER